MALLNHVNIFRDVIVVFCSNALAEPCAETLIGGTLGPAKIGTISGGAKSGFHCNLGTEKINWQNF